MRAERASASLQVVLAAPALVLVVMLVFQLALYEHASHIVTAAAQHGATAAQFEQSTASAGEAAARRFLGRTDRGLLRDSRVDVGRSAEGARVVVRAKVVSLVPGFTFEVRGVSDGPTERFRGRTDR
ncbi:MAG TPA: TadE/TadG family type IV pilus assembly protein [Acidimicrobiia bacterium]|nr:TadE/TadG family type IV pilus assembly protein [Acidimicrobiia bacterium]